MQATNGSASPRRTRGRAMGCVLLLALVVTALVLAPAAANARKAAPGKQVAPETSDLVMLGDSITFGYSEERFNIHFPTESPSFFEEGVANDTLKLLRKSLGKGLTLVNDACPGETSNGLIGENPALGGQASTESYEEVEGKPAEKFPAGGYQGLGDWHPCKWAFRNHLPLHNGGYFEGSTEVSQLEEALATVKSTNPVTEEPTKVKAITVNIGSNDELAAITQCEDEVTLEFMKEGKSKYGATPESAVNGCIAATAFGVTVPHIVKNLGDILGVLEANYSGPIILVGFYNPDADVLAGTDLLQKGANEAVEAELLPKFPHVTFANPFPVFNKGYNKLEKKPEMEQESICAYTEMCNPNVQVKNGKPAGKDGDIHPSIKGYKALAKLIAAAYEANPAK